MNRHVVGLYGLDGTTIQGVLPQFIPSRNTSGGGIQSYREYLKLYGKDKRRTSVTEKLSQLQSALYRKYRTEIDPVVYIMELYFGKEPISADGILQRLQELGIEYTNVNSILCLLGKTFGWTLRDSGDRVDSTIRKRAKIEKKQGEELKSRNAAVALLANEIAEKIFGEILRTTKVSPEKIDAFNVRILSTKDTKILGKVLYLLETFRGITFDSIITIYKAGVSVHLIVKNVQKIVDEICSEQGIDTLSVHENAIIYQLKKSGIYEGQRKN